jgi:transcriptional regulator with XRE-family HTH domain
MLSMASRKRKIPAEVRSLGEAIRRLRVEKRMTLRALAEKIGVSAPFLSDLEHGRRQTNQFEALADALDVDVEDLRSLDGRVTELKEWLAENPQLVSLLKDLRDSGKPVPLEALRAAVKKSRE